jgi:pimeloyl-ACP methyl ester carboxylesterase
MRKSARIAYLFVLGMLSSVVLGVVLALTAAVSLAATALIVPGTGTPNANNVEDYLKHATDRYIKPFYPTCTFTTCHPRGIDYPASFFPLGFIGNWCPGYSCDTWNESVGAGVDATYTALQNLNDPDGAILFGYSQGGAVVSNTLRRLEGDPLKNKVKSVVLIGNAYNPDGGIFTRLGFLPSIPPPLDITFGPPMPTNTGIPITSIGFEYDPVMYAPQYWGNGLTMLNALAAFETVHGYYLTPNGNGPMDPIAYGYTEPELAAILATPCPGPNCRVDSNGNKYYMIPAKSLPIMDLLTSALPAPVRPFFKPFVDLASPVMKVIIDLGYDWSGDPGVPRTLSLLPFNPLQNWPAVAVKLVAATIQGIQAFLGDLGGLPALVPATVAPTSNTPVSTLAAARMTATTEPTETTETTGQIETTEKVSETEKSTLRLTLVKDPETTVQQTAVETDGSSADETPVAKPEDKPVTKLKEATQPASTADEKKSDDKKDDAQKDATDADATDKDANEKKTDTDKKVDVDKKTDTDNKADTDKKDADSAKAAA